MNGVYKSLRVRVQDTLQRGKTNSMPPARANNGSTSSLDDEMENLERIVADSIGMLKAAVKEGEAAVAEEVRQAEQLVESLRGNIAMLEARLRDMEDNVRRKESARQKLGESLTATIQDLQKDVKKKDELLETQNDEVNALKSNIDGQVKRVAELELVVEKAKQEAASHVKRAEDLAESSQSKIAGLESQLREAEELARQTESTIKGLEQKLGSKIQEFKSLARDKEELLAGRDAEINDLKSQLKLLTKGIGEMSSFFRQAEALTRIEGHDASTAVQNDPVDRSAEKPVTVESKAPKVTPIVPDASRWIVSEDIFQCIAGELAEITGIMSPLASLIVREHVTTLGESIEQFPRTRLPELLENLAKEISDENRQIDFRERLAQNAQISPN